MTNTFCQNGYLGMLPGRCIFVWCTCCFVSSLPMKGVHFVLLLCFIISSVYMKCYRFFFLSQKRARPKKKKVVLNWWKDEIYLRLYLCSYRQISYYMIKDSQMVLKNVLEFQCKGCAEMISGQNFKLRKEVDRAKLLICSPLSRRPDWKVSLSLVCHCDQVHGFVVLSVNW